MVVCNGDGFLQYLENRKEGSFKKYLQLEIQDINEQNKHGECFLFVSCYFIELEISAVLLNLGANPNIQNNSGNTPLHAAAYFGNLKLIQLLVDYGGDIRIVNNEGLRPSQVVKNVKNRNKIKIYEKSLFENFKNHIKINREPILIPFKRFFLFENILKMKGNQSQGVNPYFSYQSGFGNYFWKNRAIEGIISPIKTLYNSSNLSKEEIFPHCVYGSVALYKSYWNYEKVSIKMIKSFTGKENAFDVKEEILSNFLYKEAEMIGALRHPNILLLMGINLVLNEAIPNVYYQLIFERCNMGCLNHVLYNSAEANKLNIPIIFEQIINAVNFIHSHSIVHASLSSYAIYLINEKVAKLGNFEYAVELKYPSFIKKTRLISQLNLNDNIYKWMAPEVLNAHLNISNATDVYGIAVTLAESYIHQIPNSDRSFKDIVNNYQAPYNINAFSFLPEKLKILLNDAMKYDLSFRPNLKNIQSALLEHVASISIYAEVDKQKLNSSKNICVTRLDSGLTNKYISCSENSESEAVRKSCSINSLDRTVKYIPSTVSDSTYSQNYYYNTLGYINNRRRKDTFCYKMMAALPTKTSPDVWRYPGPQTERISEGTGSLSNQSHKSSLTRGMKPASHQIGLSTSHTNISSITDTDDLIKASSRTQLIANKPPIGILKSGSHSSISNSHSSHFYKSHLLLSTTNKEPASPTSKNVASLIQQYEHTEAHPYSLSPTSTILKGPGSVISNNSYSSDNRKYNTLSPNSTPSKYKKYFTSLFRGEENQLISKRKGKNIVPDLVNSDTNFQTRLFGDLTNNFS